MERRYLVGMIVGIVAVLAVAFAIVRRIAPPPVEQLSQPITRPAPPPMTVVAPAPAPPTPTEVPAAPAAKNSQPPAKSATGPTPRPAGPQRIPLLDIADPFEAVEIVHLRRGEGDTIEIGARNRSRRAVFVKSVDLFAESDELVPLDNVGFWLPVGGSVETTREVPELSRRLRDNENLKAVINEAEFRDTPPEELAK